MLHWETANRFVARYLVCISLRDNTCRRYKLNYENAFVFTRDVAQLGFYLFRIRTRELPRLKQPCLAAERDR